MVKLLGFLFYVFIIILVFISYNEEKVIEVLGLEKEDFLYDFVYTEKINTTLIEDYIFNMTNGLRRSKNINELKRNKDLDMLSRYQSKNMVIFNFFNHTDHEGLDPTGRAKKFFIKTQIDRGRYFTIGIAENLGETPWYSNVKGCGDTTSNYDNAICAFNGWVNSKGHYANLVGNSLEIGIGVYVSENNIVYYTQNFR